MLLLMAVLCIGTTVMWFRSYWYFDVVELKRWHSASIISDRGDLTFCLSRQFPAHVVESTGFSRFSWMGPYEPYSHQWTLDHLSYPESFTSPAYGFLGFGRSADMSFSSEDIGRPGMAASFDTEVTQSTCYSAPAWFIMVLTGVMPVLWIFALLRRKRAMKRIARGLCGNCGYDLRAFPGRCPECGAIYSAVSAGGFGPADSTSPASAAPSKSIRK